MNLTYLLGAGASANALPVVKNIMERMAAFIGHLTTSAGLSGPESRPLWKIYHEISNHYTIDTYAKKLFLKGASGQKELFKLYNFMGAYFIYEQLKKDPSNAISSYLYKDEKDPEINKSIIKTVDYRYDSFFAAVLKNGRNGMVCLPENINIVSWNYDFQIEISFMNFIDNFDLNKTQEHLNIYPTPQLNKLKEGSSIVKVNGTAGFYEAGKTFGNLFDFSKHSFDEESIDVIKNILFQERESVKNSIYFAWNNDNVAKAAREAAKQIIKNTDILVVIGYSFPYFNRDTDRFMFSEAGQKGKKIYIQTTADTFESIKNRGRGVYGEFEKAIPFTELDQFLIPNEFQ